MKLALIGYGNMGKLIHNIAETQGHSVVAICHSKNPLSLPSSQKAVVQADMCLDFSTPNEVLEHINILAKLNKSIVVGTTGWTEYLADVEKIVKKMGIGLLHAPNFSLGIALFLNIIKKTARLMAPFPQYEVAGIEMHHNKKKDSPSGTAKAIAQELSPHYQQLPPFSSVRVGNIPGTHSVIFDSSEDTITLTHTARNREGFAQGALVAAEWLQGKKGIFTLHDLLNENHL